MDDINSIFVLLDWNRPQSIQKLGIEKAKAIKDISVFFQPNVNSFNKNVWDNCALIIARRSDKELIPYYERMIYWLQDLNWPGSMTILKRLKKVRKRKELAQAMAICFEEAIKTKDLIWTDNMCLFANIFKKYKKIILK